MSTLFGQSSSGRSCIFFQLNRVRQLQIRVIAANISPPPSSTSGFLAVEDFVSVDRRDVAVYRQAGSSFFQTNATQILLKYSKSTVFTNNTPDSLQWSLNISMFILPQDPDCFVTERPFTSSCPSNNSASFCSSCLPGYFDISGSGSCFRLFLASSYCNTSQDNYIIASSGFFASYTGSNNLYPVNKSIGWVPFQQGWQESWSIRVQAI
jgi:hypothetical protein